MTPNAAPEVRTRSAGRVTDRGFMMVAILVGMAITAIYMTAALPAWRLQAQRLKEAELVFRGEQYARAIMLYMQKNKGQPPPNIDILVSQRYLRKKWKDPVTGKDFCPVGPGVVTKCEAAPPQTGFGQQGTTPAPSGPIQGGQQMGITGVRSGSPETSLKVYEGQQRYDQWPFDAQRLQMRLGQTLPRPPQQPNQPGRGQPGRDGQPGTGVPGRGNPVPVPGRGGTGPGSAGPIQPRPGGVAGS